MVFRGKATPGERNEYCTDENNFKRTFGFYIGSMKLKDIKPLDVQRALNAMEQNQVSHSAMREAWGV